MSRDPWPDRRHEIEWFLPVLKYRERGERRGGGEGGEEGIEWLCVYRYREGKRDSGSARARARVCVCVRESRCRSITRAYTHVTECV
jgi:hypothetical protein